ncbi:hypothetical protein [Deinococcus sp. NW-56]|uniref:hypothetical protein n=1 Tax=Deinococcus sp. NW-56 TaxID=2080419 RepID=UPI000CF4F24E|nr:hypothetical protein [Deinococcus sp. NW-56]
MKGAPVPDRELPEHWALCRGCGGPLPALAHPGEYAPHCPTCTRADLLRHAAGDSLAALALPALGAWAHHWARVGVSVQELSETVEELTGSDMAHEYRRSRLRSALARALRTHRPPTVTPSPPDRVTVNPAALPVIIGAQLNGAGKAPSSPGKPDRRRSFTVREPGGEVREAVTLPPGPDALLILGADPAADAVLYFTGIHGATEPRTREGYRVPAAMLDAVREALGYWGSAGGEA